MRHLFRGKLTLFSAGAFALIAIGFFLFIFFWHSQYAPSEGQMPPNQLTLEEKQQILNQLSASFVSTSSPQTHQSKSQNSVAGVTQNRSGAAIDSSPSSDQADPDAARKLQILRALTTAH